MLNTKYLPGYVRPKYAIMAKPVSTCTDFSTACLENAVYNTYYVTSDFWLVTFEKPAFNRQFSSSWLICLNLYLVHSGGF